MKVRFIFFKAIALCAILILSSCQSKEEKVISRMNDLAEQIEKNGELDNWDDIDRMDLATEYALILKDMQNCEFTNEQQIELFKACKNVSVALGSISGNGLPEGMEDMLKGMDSMLDGMKAYSDGLDESDEVSEDENKDVDKEDVVLPKVYSNCFDGYLNVRAEPSSKSKILGTLPNGPEGAELLGVDGKWSKVRVNGVVGYVWSADVQSTPTEPVFISASDVVGDWMWADENAHMIFYTIESNGKFEAEGAWGFSSSGTWYLSRNKLVLKDSDGEVTTCTVNGDAIKIDGREYFRYEE